MFCGQCGKRVLETMLFCPFCGSPIVIPDQAESAAPQAESAAPQAESAAPQAESAAPQAESAAPQAESAAPQAEAAAPEAEAAVREVPDVREAEAAREAEAERKLDSLFEVAPEPAPATEPMRVPEPKQIYDVEPEPARKPEPEKAFEPLRFDAPEPEVAPSPQPVAPSERPLSLFDDFPSEPVERSEPPKVPEPENIPGRIGLEKPERMIPLEDPPRRQESPRRRPEGGVRRGSRAYIPVKDVDIDDIFMDSSHPPREERYDPYDDADGDDSFEEDYDFEEPERGGFVQRHIRGLVGLSLLAMVIVISLIWAAMPRGQRLLASVNLAWSSTAYDDLGHEAYEAGQFRQAATYFERALARDGDNYEYAHSAMVAYYEAKETDSALAMLKKCIEMNPASAEPYHELLILYPDAQQRPWEVQELLRQGYERTGDEALKPADASTTANAVDSVEVIPVEVIQGNPIQ